MTILPSLIQNGAKIVAHDPEGIKEAKNLLPEEMIYVETIDDALSNADAVVLMTEWNQYRGLDLDRIKNIMRGNVFIDLRNVYEPSMMRENGFDYHCVGR